MDEIGVLLVGGRVLPTIGLRTIVGQCADIKVLGEAATFDAAIRRARRLTPDVIVVDAGTEDFDLAQYVGTVLRQYGLPSSFLIVAETLTPMVWRALQTGAGGFLLERNTPAHLIPALRMVAMGYALMAADTPPLLTAEDLAGRGEAADPAVKSLTNREVDILDLMARGLSNSDISQALDLAESTVKSHIGSVFAKLGLRNRVQAVIYAYEAGLVRVNGDRPLSYPTVSALLGRDAHLREESGAHAGSVGDALSGGHGAGDHRPVTPRHNPGPGATAGAGRGAGLMPA